MLGDARDLVTASWFQWKGILLNSFYGNYTFTLFLSIYFICV